MDLGDFASLIQFACGAGMAFACVAVAWTSSSVLKRIGALCVCGVGVLMSLSALDAPASLMISALAVSIAQLGVGVALVVRLQEAHDSADMSEIDAHDGEDAALRPEA